MDKPTDFALNSISQDDQTWFASQVNDWNPIHLDKLIAKSSMFGRPIVHGLHQTIQQIDQIGKLDLAPWLNQSTPARLTVSYRHPTYPGEETKAVIAPPNGNTLKISTYINELCVNTLRLKPAELSKAKNKTSEETYQDITLGISPLPMSISDLTKLPSWKVIFPELTNNELTTRYPHAAHLLGEDRLMDLARLSSLVGMVAPGLYSLFVSIDVTLLAGNSPSQVHNSHTDYSVKSVHEDFGFLQTQVSTNNLIGRLEAVRRPSPVKQPGINELKKALENCDFEIPNINGKQVLIIGGSRGIGALTVKLLALAGAQISFTYASNASSAAELCKELKGYDVSASSLDVLSKDFDDTSLAEKHFDQIYYFATPQIFSRKTKFFDQELYARFNHFYISSFERAVRYFAKDGASIFYPSTTEAEGTDNATVEYRMAKLSGEILCEALANKKQNWKLVVKRLPRIDSDQTAQIQSAQSQDGKMIISKIISKMSENS